MNNRNFLFRSIFTPTWKPTESGETLQGHIVDTYQKILRDDPVPFVSLADEDGEIVEAICGNAALSKLYFSGELKQGRFLALRYDGESETIVKMGHKAKLYSYYLADEHGNEIQISLDSDQTVMDPYGQPMERSERNQKKINNQAVSPPQDIDFEVPFDAETNPEDKRKTTKKPKK